MKRNHKICVLALFIGAGINCGAYAVTPATCLSLFQHRGDVTCEQYSVEEYGVNSGSVYRYLCTCEKCPDGYHIEGDTDDWSAMLVSMTVCKKNPASGDSGTGTDRPTETTCKDYGGTLCTACRGPSVTINGQIYCGMWANTGSVQSCTIAGAGSAYLMGPCCNSEAQTVGYTSGCYAMGCKSGMQPAINYKSCTCKIGYYGSASSSCTQCPSSGLTDETGAAQITDCFIPSGVTLTDGTGSYQYSDRCNYQ